MPFRFAFSTVCVTVAKSFCAFHKILGVIIIAIKHSASSPCLDRSALRVGASIIIASASAGKKNSMAYFDKSPSPSAAPS